MSFKKLNKKGGLFGFFIGVILFAFVGYMLATKWATGTFFGACRIEPAFDLSGLCNAIKTIGTIIGGIVGFFIGRFIPI